MYDDNTNEEDGRYNYQPPSTTALKPGDPGYRMSVWAPDYNPGANWNNGVYAPPSPRYDWNNDSPPDQALTPGHGWKWEGPQNASWNMSTNQWDRGVWQERLGEGHGYVAPPNTPPPGPTGGAGPTAPAPTGSGAVSSVPANGGITVPSSTLPADISGLFGQQPTKTPIQGAYQDALLKYMSRSQETPSLSDSTLAPQVEVFRAAAQRGQERQRLSAAERAAANGQSESGYLDNVINKGIQDQNFNTASYNANLLGGEMNKRREELQAGLQLASATGNAEASRELQTRLAQVSAAMQQQGLNLQGQLGFGDLDLRRLLGTESLNQQALQIIMGGL
ncbi:MAG: hypothetical protein Q8O42_09450 [Acidobacteriota bacterium]|nr:hypothetical protein [Acidobacteriota bacterium]